MIPAIAPEQPTSNTAPPQPIPTLTISQPPTMTPTNKNNTAVQKAVSGGEPRHITTTTKEGEEEVTELVPVTENKKIDAKQVKMVVSANADGKDVNKDVIPNAGTVATVTFKGGEDVNKDVITNTDSVNNKPAAVATSKAKADINIEAPGPGAKKMAWSHPNTKGGTIPGLKEKKSQGVQKSSGATSVEKHHRVMLQ